jgi:hypothetical protein
MAWETLVAREAYGVHMLQVATPPLPPTPPPGVDLNFLSEQLMPIIALVAVFVGLRWLFRTPVGEALAERIRMRARGRWGVGVTGEDPHRVAALEEHVSQLQGQVAELAERLDFAERLLAEQRGRKLGAGQ